MPEGEEVKDNTMVLLGGEVGLVVLGIGGLLVGQMAIAYVAVGAFAGLVAGHLNGAQKEEVP